MDADAISPSWDWQRDFCGKNLRLTVMQRPVAEVRGLGDSDFSPFLHVVTLFQLIPRQGSVSTIKGLLLDLQESPGKLELTIEDSETSASYRWLLRDVELASRLTVWRVNDVLDAIQVRIEGSALSLYMQTGGSALLTVFESDEAWVTEPREIFIDQTSRRLT